MIQVEEITKYYQDFCAVDRVSLNIRKGEILGLLGPNGAGKTTTIRMLTGYYKPTSGNITIDGLSIHDHELEIKKMIGYLPESAPIYKDMLVYDYLSYIADIRGLSGKEKQGELHKLSDLCGLSEIMHKSVGELSKGLKQRVGIAHAMMHDPAILILDEPTSGLDPNQIVEIRNIIKKIGREKTIIFSTHILSEAEATCDRIVIINKGHIVADGSTESIKSDAGQKNTLELSVASADPRKVSELLTGIEGIGTVEEIPCRDDDASGFRVTYNAGGDLRESIYRKIRETDWVLLNFHQETRSLESIFRELTREN